MNIMTRGLAAATLALFTLPALADLYKCSDAQGRAYYTDQPSARCLQAGTAIKAPSSAQPAAENVAPPAPKSLQEQELEFRKRRAERAEEELKAQKEAQLKAQNCDAARANLASYTQAGRVLRYTPQGEREYLSDEQRAEETEKWRREVARWCGP
ncbi:DUF4124 domain-containing protein [Pelomicrobium sp. G1]|uniref:DUF4124 domain-containing protein n=1 Tax=unclassified Pelomicrobium TaxID=2815318 RepID=UPI0021DE752A|nr:MAG: hypothetical protein KatS3mg123_0384 [Burkholderiales bacterium]